MRYAKITYPDVNNGIGCRVSLWLQGCSIRCKECFNKELWGSAAGHEFTEETFQELCSVLDKEYITGLSVLGGEPTDQYQQLIPLLTKIKSKYPDKDIWMWTGHTLGDIRRSSSMSPLLTYLDYVVDGNYDPNYKRSDLLFRGSSNQHIWKHKYNTWQIID